jgi:hypothetical protein
MTYVIVERIFDPPLTQDEHMARSMRLLGCLAPAGIRWIRSYVSNDRRFGGCEFEAADAESVRVAHHTADDPFVRVWTAECFTP